MELAAASTMRKANASKLIFGGMTKMTAKKVVYIAVLAINIAYYLTLILIASSIFNRCLDWLVSVW